MGKRMKDEQGKVWDGLDKQEDTLPVTNTNTKNKNYFLNRKWTQQLYPWTLHMEARGSNYMQAH